MFARLEAVLINKPEKPDNISICLTHSPIPFFDASPQQIEIKYALCKLKKKKKFIVRAFPKFPKRYVPFFNLQS